MNMRIAVIAATLLTSSLAAQTSADHIALGDKEHEAGKAPEALKHYEAAIAADPKNGEALWRAAKEAVDVGEFNPKRDSLYKLAEQYARQAVAVEPNSALAHFALAKSIGRHAQSLGTRDRVKFAGEVRKEALESMRLDSLNPGALHVLGMWNAEIMRLNGFSRFMAKNLLGGKTFGEANWDDAVKFLQHAAALEPHRVIHAVELGAVYADRGEKDKARAEYQRAIALKAVEFNDAEYQKRAQKELADIK